MGAHIHAPRHHIGQIITDHRITRNLTLVQLAKYVGADHTTIHKWETTGRIPGRGVLLKLSKVLDIPLETLLSSDAAPWTKQQQH